MDHYRKDTNYFQHRKKNVKKHPQHPLSTPSRRHFYGISTILQRYFFSAALKKYR